jgi:ABC-type glycerol-3-phosphate transport system substrate-binding protein
MPRLSTFQITLLAIFGSLGIAGVLIFALITASGSANAIGPVVIWGTIDGTALNQALRDAADNDSRFSQVTYLKVDPTQFDANLKTALASGKGPDLFLMTDDHAYRDASYALHIPYAQFPQSQFQSTFLDTATPFLAADGIVGVPVLVDPLVLFWNKDALATAGIAAPPQYWDQVPGMVESLVKKNDSGTVQKAGIAFGSFDNIGSAKDIIATLILQAGGGITGLDSEGVLRSQLASQGGSTAAVTALDFFTEFADPSQPDYSWSRAFQDAQASFAAADVAMYVGHASEYASIAATNPNLNFAMAPLPQIRSAQYTVDTSHVYALAIARNSQNARGALTVAYLMAGPDFVAPVAKSLGMASALRRVVTPNSAPAQASDQTSAALQNLVSNSQKTPETLLDFEANISKPWVDPDPDKTSQLFRDMINDTVSGSLKSVDAVQRADKTLGTILNP